MGGTVPVVGDKPVFAVEFLSFRLAVMSFDNGYRVGRVEVGKFGEEQFAAELAANRIFYRDGAGLPVADFGLPRAWPAVLQLLFPDGNRNCRIQAGVILYYISYGRRQSVLVLVVVPADLFAGDRLAVHRPPCVPDVGCDEGDQ